MCWISCTCHYVCALCLFFLRQLCNRCCRHPAGKGARHALCIRAAAHRCWRLRHLRCALRLLCLRKQCQRCFHRALMATFPPDASLILCDHHLSHNVPYVHITRILGLVLPHGTVVSSTAAAQCIAESVPSVAVLDAVETPAATSSVVLAQIISDMPTLLSDCDDDSCSDADCDDDSGSDADLQPKMLNIRESRAMRVLGLLKAEDPSNGRNSRRAWQQVQHWVATRAAAEVVSVVVEYAQPSAMFQHVNTARTTDAIIQHVNTARTTDARSALHSYFAQFAGCRDIYSSRSRTGCS